MKPGNVMLEIIRELRISTSQVKSLTNIRRFAYSLWENEVFKRLQKKLPSQIISNGQPVSPFNVIFFNGLRSYTVEKFRLYLIDIKQRKVGWVKKYILK